VTITLSCRPITSRSLEVAESPMVQSPGAQVIYALDVTNIGSSPSSSAVSARNISTGQTVTAQVLSGVASAANNIITLPTLKSLVAGNEYQLDIQFTLTGSATPLERFLRVICRD
jgi:hypothetical protein